MQQCAGILVLWKMGCWGKFGADGWMDGMGVLGGLSGLDMKERLSWGALVSVCGSCVRHVFTGMHEYLINESWAWGKCNKWLEAE